MAEFKVEEHILVPQHEILKDDEVEKILAKYNIKKEQLPKILVSDPCAMVLGAKPGQVLKITRRRLREETSFSPCIAGVSITYRVVIDEGVEW